MTAVAAASVSVSDAPAAHVAAAPTAQVPGDSLTGRWVLDRAASGDVRRAIDTVTGRMNFFIRPIARSRLRSANEMHDRLTVTITSSEISTQVDQMAPITSPAGGAEVTWRRENGDQFQLHAVLAGQRLVQTFVGRDGSRRENVFTPGEDGRSLNIAVTVSHARLPMPLRYRLVYRRD